MNNFIDRIYGAIVLLSTHILIRCVFGKMFPMGMMGDNKF